MYKYDEYDRRIVAERAAQFRQQTRRYLAGELSEQQFLPLRLQNGLYVQRFAPMLRIAIPYGMVSSQQMRKLANIARKYDKGYVHITTRQNIQLNWPRLEDVPDILEELAAVDMHAIQTSGNCIRSVTTDQFAGVAADEIVDPRPWCEIIRQWSTLHPEFAFLPRKFKIAVTGAKQDRAATQVHDIGIHALLSESNQIRFRILVGGGLGRTPVIGSIIKQSLKPENLLTYLEAILRVYNRYGRRDNKYKARIKILVKAMTAEVFSEKVENEWLKLKKTQACLSNYNVQRIHQSFTKPRYHSINAEDMNHWILKSGSPLFRQWLQQNVTPHKQSGYASVTLTLKNTANAPGDISSEQLETIADLADIFSFGELRTSHEQNIIFPDVRQNQLLDLWLKLNEIHLAKPNLGQLTDVICCPGGDYCSLANTKTLPLAEAIQDKFDGPDYLHMIGALDINLSGCMNACAHHHVGDIGILGVDRKGKPFYQIQIGGHSGNQTPAGKNYWPFISA